VEVRIAADGEILARGPNIMLGYWNDQAATNEVIQDGWLYTGDLGELDEDGYLRITGRKKEIIVTATGKNIAPTLIESLLCRDPLIEQAMVLGDDQSFLAALIVPNRDHLNAELEKRQLQFESMTAMLADEAVCALFAERIQRQLSNLSHHEQVRKFVLLDRGFTIDAGHLTPKASLRRDVITREFARQIAELFE
jgi:long-chain acyl-CoA synthetase